MDLHARRWFWAELLARTVCWGDTVRKGRINGPLRCPAFYDCFGEYKIRRFERVFTDLRNSS